MIRKTLYILLISTISFFLLCSPCLDAQHIKTSLDSKTLTKNFEDLLIRTKEIAEKTKSFNQEKLLKNLSVNDLNSFYFRFDERLQEAKVYLHPKLALTGLSKNFRLSLHNNKNIFKVDSGKISVKNGLLVLETTKKTKLVNNGDLDLDSREITTMAIRLKVKKNNLIHLGWSPNQAIDWNDWYCFMNLHIINDNKFHTYLVEVGDRFMGWLNGKKVKKIGLFFPESDEVELEYIQPLTRFDKYMTGYYGVCYESINKEMRPVLFMHTPLKLGYQLKIPDKDTFLSFATGVIENKTPVDLKISIRDENRIETIFSKTCSVNINWQQEELDLQKYKGKNIELIIEVDAKISNIIFLSNPILFSKPDKRLNVIMIIQDALRADHLSLYGYFRKTSPFLDEFSKKGVVFENAFSQGIFTVSSYSSFMTSLYSSATGVWFLTDGYGLHKNFLTLPEIMRSQGFETVSIIENLDAGLIAGLNQGFDCISMETDTATLLNKTQEILGTSKRNLFIYLHLMNPHSPYNPPERFRFWYDELRKNGIAGKPVEKNSIFDPPWVDNPTVETRRALYDGAIRSNDAYLQEFIEKLKNLGILDNTLFIFTADHGEFLGEHNQWGHGLPGFTQVVHVPLIMVYPKTIPAQKRIHQNVQLLDIMPTILDFAHIDKKDMLLQGDSLIPLIQEKNIEYWNRRLCYSDGMQNAHRPCSYEPYYQASLFFDNFHLLKSLMNKKNAAGFFRIFDFISNPQEERDLSREDAENLKVESEFTDFISTFQKINSKIWEIITEKQEGKLTISQNEIQRLKNLGYLQ